MDINNIKLISITQTPEVDPGKILFGSLIELVMTSLRLLHMHYTRMKTFY
jgi:hypothetical protein